jgi:hypothetical protein
MNTEETKNNIRRWFLIGFDIPITFLALMEENPSSPDFFRTRKIEWQRD